MNKHPRIAIALAAFSLLGAHGARAGGTAEDALLIVDPDNFNGMFAANHYIAARNIPANNVLFYDPTAPDFATFADENATVFFATLAERGLDTRVDYVVLAPADSFFIPAPGLVSDTCSPVTRFSLSGAYTLINERNAILTGIFDISATNRYYTSTVQAYRFDSQTRYLNGGPSTSSSARQYYLGAMLGWGGARGNTRGELAAMIARSAAADATIPTGTFYFMETTDPFRSPPRDPLFPQSVSFINAFGGQAQLLFDVLPNNATDAIGIMTGWPTLDFNAANLTILDGAFCDHLTSWAATFDLSPQTKVSEWIRQGASGSWGAVEEPCNYPGKFPTPRVHVYYFQGLSLGEAAFRAVEFMPFQGLLYGDPLTQPFALPPTVDVPDAPAGPVSGTITITPSVTATAPNADIGAIEVLVDGELLATPAEGEAVMLDTTTLSDGWHDLRVIARDDTLQEFAGRWVGELLVDNRGRSASLNVNPINANWSTLITADITATGADVLEVRLLHAGRLVAAAAGDNAALDVYGLTLGGGPARVQAEALYQDGRRVRSAPVELSIADAQPPVSGDPPLTYSYTRFVEYDTPFLLTLPVAYDDRNDPPVVNVLSPPAQATLSGGTGPYRYFVPNASATGTDTLTFNATSTTGTSQTAIVTLVYLPCVPGELNGDGVVDSSDLNILLSNFGCTPQSGPCAGDINRDGMIDAGDLNLLLSNWNATCN